MRKLSFFPLILWMPFSQLSEPDQDDDKGVYYISAHQEVNEKCEVNASQNV